MAGIPGRESNEKSLQSLRIIWAAMFGTLFIYVLICHLLLAEIRPPEIPNLPLDLIRNILGGIAIFTFILPRFIRKRIVAGGPDGPGPVPLKSPSLSNQSSPLAKYTFATFVSLVLSEFIGIFGLVLFLLGDNFQVLYIFIGISALAMFLYRPKREEIETLAIAM